MGVVECNIVYSSQVVIFLLIGLRGWWFPRRLFLTSWKTRIDTGGAPFRFFFMAFRAEICLSYKFLPGGSTDFLELPSNSD